MSLPRFNQSLIPCSCCVDNPPTYVIERLIKLSRILSPPKFVVERQITILRIKSKI